MGWFQPGRAWERVFRVAARDTEYQVHGLGQGGRTSRMPWTGTAPSQAEGRASSPTLKPGDGGGVPMQRAGREG